MVCVRTTTADVASTLDAVTEMVLSNVAAGKDLRVTDTTVPVSLVVVVIF